MAKEIEYKFLISDTAAASEQMPFKIEQTVQGYLSVPTDKDLLFPVVRVRISSFTENGVDTEDACLTIKGPMIGMTRDEFEYPIPVNDAVEMLKLCNQRLIEKTRYFIKHGDHTIELDLFEGRHTGLIVAEIEVNSEDEHIKFPSWFGKDVTRDFRYTNAALSMMDDYPRD
jgi:adenylate cyclase